ncbi:AI-2E family transporter [Alloalcanivorax sp. C16-2]|uniref:AI-2E family transporter n=1 Tax=Alloalcanivorax sp. C16-2 TaxID=3390052 RepID=UPI0039709F11
MDDPRTQDRTGDDQDDVVTRQETRKLMERVTVRSAMLTGIFVLLVMYTLYAAATLFAPLVVAFLTSLIFTPVVRALRPLRIAPPVSAAVIVCLVFSLAVSALYGLTEPAMEWLEKAPRDLRKLELEFRELAAPMEKLRQANEQIARITPGEGGNDAAGGQVPWSPVKWLLSGTWSALYGIAISFVLLYFMLASGDTFLRKLVRVIPQFENKRAAVATVREIQNRISIYLGTISIINLCLAMLSSLILYVLGVPNPILFGVMVGMFNYAPYIGPVASFTVILLVSLLHFDGIYATLLPPALILGLNVLEGQFITPTVAGHRLQLSPVAVFLSILLWGWMWGVVGILIAVPLLVCIKLVCDNIPSLRLVSAFLGR